MKYCPTCQQTFAIELRVCPADGAALALKDMYGLSGRVLAGKYQIGPLAALGGMSAVYRAHQIGVKRQVAFKILLPELAVNHPRMLDRFEREAHLAGLLTHENVATIHDAGQTEDHFAYIVMEWLDGHLLENELQQRRYPSFERIAYLLRQVAAALDAAHTARVIHRDLKPTNIMIMPRPDGRDWVKVFDFGLAKVLSDSLNLQISHALGTPHYASPEQFRPGAEINGQSDVYSLGIVLYRMLTRRVPFDAPDVHEMIRLHLLEAPPPLTRWRPDLPVEVEQLVNRMLAKTPHYRPATATEAVILFEEAVGKLPAAERARVVPAPTRAQAATAAAVATPRAATVEAVRQTKQLVMPAAAAAAFAPAPTAPPPPAEPAVARVATAKLAPPNTAPSPARHNPRTLVLLGLAALLLAALAGYFLFQSKPEQAAQRAPLPTPNVRRTGLVRPRLQPPSDLRRNL